MNYTSVIGLEVHVQLKTNTKIFCSCKNEFGAEPNTFVCPVCLGLPGTLPVLNKKVLEYAIKAGMAVDCRIADISKLDRKNYFYPDLPKAYQISQYDQPLCEKGYIEIMVDEEKHKIGITRIHIEEDAGKLIHAEKGDKSFVDYNRTGVPLIEIVSEPDLRSGEQAYEYLKSLKAILEYLEISDCNMQEGSLRCDANISIMPEGAKEFGTRSETKNLNSFKAVQKAIEYEIARQIGVVESGEKVIQETRLWDVDKGVTVSMRTKEEAHDYRYFPEPDIMTIYLNDQEYINKIKESMPELPKQRKMRFIKEYSIPEYDAEILTADKALADYFEQVCKNYDNAKTVSNWIMGDLLKELNNASMEVKDSKVEPEDLVKLLNIIDAGDISLKSAKIVFEEMFQNAKDPEQIIQEKGLKQISDSSELKAIIKEAIASNPKAVEEYKAGKQKAMGYFIGQVMYKTQGKADPKVVTKIVQEMLK